MIITTDEQSYLKVCYGAQTRLLGNNLNPNAIDENQRIEVEKTLLQAVDEAHALGACSVAFLAGKWEEASKEKAYTQLVKTTETICRYAAKKEITINLEIFDFDLDKAALIGPAPYTAKFAADMRCRCNNFGVIVDLSHFPITYETNRAASRRVF